jgi:NAD-dependent deacetylase
MNQTSRAVNINGADLITSFTIQANAAFILAPEIAQHKLNLPLSLDAQGVFMIFYADMFEVSRNLIDLITSNVPVAVLTGAGVSAESGVPTFRGTEGLWRKFKPEELANVDAFLNNPDLVWSWYQHRREIIRDVAPNPGHECLARLESKVSDFTLITQNVDDLHRRAGSRNILELHGNIVRNKCIKCGMMIENLAENESKDVPKCPCGGLIRPDVVWFGEMLPRKVVMDAFSAAERSAVFFSIGTSGVVQPAASLPVTAKNAGAYLVEINIEPTVLTSFADEYFEGKSGEVLPYILKECGLK